jgi:hypothetical protein
MFGALLFPSLADGQHHDRPERPHVSMRLPKLIEESDIARYNCWLQFDKTEAGIALVFAADYTSIVPVRRECEGFLLSTGIDASDHSTAGRRNAHAVSIAAMLAARAEFVRVLEERDNWLLEQWGNLLDSSRQDAIELVMLDRKRVRTNIYESHLPSAKVDLIDILDAVDREWHLSAATNEAVFLYLRSIVPALEQRDRSRPEEIAEDCRLIALTHMRSDGQPVDRTDPSTVAYLESLFEERVAIRRSMHRDDKRIAAVHRHFMPTIAATLAPEARLAFETIYLDRCYPIIRPDPLDFLPVYDGLLGIQTLSESVRDQVSQARATYLPQRVEATERMQRRYDEWKDHIGENLRFTTQDRAAYAEEMKAHHAARLRLADTQVEILRGIVPSEQLNAVAEWADWLNRRQKMAAILRDWRPP